MSRLTTRKQEAEMKERLNYETQALREKQKAIQAQSDSTMGLNSCQEVKPKLYNIVLESEEDNIYVEVEHKEIYTIPNNLHSLNCFY